MGWGSSATCRSFVLLALLLSGCALYHGDWGGTDPDSVPPAWPLVVEGPLKSLPAALKMLPAPLEVAAAAAVEPLAFGPSHQQGRAIGVLVTPASPTSVNDRSLAEMKVVVDRLEAVFAEEGSYPTSLPRDWTGPGWAYQSDGEDFTLGCERTGTSWRYSSIEGLSVVGCSEPSQVKAAAFLPREASRWSWLSAASSYRVGPGQDTSLAEQLEQKVGFGGNSVRVIVRSELLARSVPSELVEFVRRFSHVRIDLVPEEGRLAVHGYGFEVDPGSGDIECAQWLERLPEEARLAAVFDPVFLNSLGLVPEMASDEVFALGADVVFEPLSWRRQWGRIRALRVPLYALGSQGSVAAGWRDWEMKDCLATSLGGAAWSGGSGADLPAGLPGQPKAAGRIVLALNGRSQRWVWAAGVSPADVWLIAESGSGFAANPEQAPSIRAEIEATHQRQTTVRAAVEGTGQPFSSWFGTPRLPFATPSRSSG